MLNNRFVNNVPELEESNRSPIDGYQYLPNLTLEQAVEKIIPLLPNVVDYVSIAKNECNQHSTLLTIDESAAIYLYTMPVPFFSRLNEILRGENRDILEPWFAFLKLFITALEKLSSTKKIIWRGVSGDVGSAFDDGYVHIWWSVNSCSMDLTIIERFLGGTGTVFAIDAVHGKDISAFSAFPGEQEIVLMPGTRLSAKCHSINFISRYFLVSLQEDTSQSYICELIKHEYQRNSRIEYIMNPSKSFPIKQSYINLAIIETKEQQTKEKKLLDAKFNNEIIGTYEEIYGTKTKIEIKNIFEKCKDQTKNVLVFGRAGIGKTTFCQYVAYQWAIGEIWQQYQLVIVIRLRNLTESKYPSLSSGIKYSLIDLVKTEYCCQNLSENDEKLFQQQLNDNQVLWILDGYDEIIQNIPIHLKYLLEQLLKTPHHILTTRPYLNTLSYKVQLEITGFTNDNIEKYVKKFFNQIEDEIDNASIQEQKLLNFLKCNPRIWGIVHIPVNLELICSLWSDTNWSETTILTMTCVYDKMIEWLCRRYLEKQKNISSNQMTKEDVYADCCKELAFLESFAFNGMKSKSIILPPELLRKACKEFQISLRHHPHLLNIGILKSLDNKSTGTRIEVDKSHYFLHLSFQEYFAARYLINALKGDTNQKKKAIDFIKFHKYDQRFELVLTFASGLLIDSNDDQYMNLFWEILLEEPLDLIGVRHVQIVISCLEEAGCNKNISRLHELVNLIIKWINYMVSVKYSNLHDRLLTTLRRSSTLINQPEILHTFIKLYEDKDPSIKTNASSFIFDFPFSNPDFDWIQLHLRALHDKIIKVRMYACKALEKIGEKAATNEVINRLLVLLGDTNYEVRSAAFKALRKMGEKPATSEVIDRLLILFGDTDYGVRSDACEALVKMGEKAAANEVINRLLILLSDSNCDARISACKALSRLGEKAANNEVISRLSILLIETDDFVRTSACEALARMGEKVGNTEVINRLVILLGDAHYFVRARACEPLGKIGEKAATDEVINRLSVLLSDVHYMVRRNACEALGGIGKKAANNEIINKLLILLDDTGDLISKNACKALGKMGEKAATDEVINKLFIRLVNTDYEVRSTAIEALQKMGEKAATNEVINRFLDPLNHTNYVVRRNACLAVAEMNGKAATTELIDRLLVLLGDTDCSIRRSAFEALIKMGDKTPTNEVINRLLILLSSTDDDVRWTACEALGKMGKIAATDEVINKLLILLDDTYYFVRRSACEALGKMGENAATDEVINKLLILFNDTDYSDASNAFEALVKMGQKATTNEVINRLLIRLRDRTDDVRMNACKVLGELDEKVITSEVMNELLTLLCDRDYGVKNAAYEALEKVRKQAATDEVINGLLTLLRNTDDIDRDDACEALVKIGEKVATNEVIGVLLDVACEGHGMETTVMMGLDEIFDFLPHMSVLKDETVQKLWKYIFKLDHLFLKNIGPEKCIKAFLDTEILYWRPIIRSVFTWFGYGITITKNTFVLYGSEEPIQLSVSNSELGQQLRDYLVDWLDK